jgi:hypothetical protein
MKAYTAWAVLSLSTFLLTACGTNGLSGNAGQITGEAVGYTGARTALEARLGNTKIGSGVIDSDGRFNLQLQDPLPESVLESLFLSISKLCPDADVSAPETKSFMLNSLNVSSSATLTYTNWNPTDKVPPAELISGARMYVNRDLSVKGTCNANLGTGGAPYPTEFNLTLKQGWNAVTFGIQGSSEEIVRASLRSGEPSNARWYYTTQ